MSIWINQDTKVMVQGITGKAAAYHTKQMLAYGTKLVGGVSPGKGGILVEGLPVFDTVKEAADSTGAAVSIIYVPAPYAADAILEAVDAQLDLVICITEHIPILDMLKVKQAMKGKNTRLIGPNCPGIITPGECKIGIMPGHIHKKGHIGIVSRSGTLTYEAVNALSSAGIGQSTVVGIGGDPVNGTNFIDVLSAFQQDPETHGVILIGEIGGSEEEKAARWIEAHMDKPVVGFIGGKTAPPGKRMGHAGAIVSGNKGTAQSKIATLEDCGISVAQSVSEIASKLLEAMEGKTQELAV